MARRKKMTIDELAQQAGVASRKIRYYQTRGLLPPPAVEGRTGYYGQHHIDRLKLIQEMQGEGLNLQAISWLLAGAGAVDSNELRRLKRAVLDGWVTDQPVTVQRGDLRRGLSTDDVEDRLIQRAVELRLIEPTDDPERWRLMLPGVLAAGLEMREMGAEVERSLDVLETMREHATAVAEAYVTLFDEAVLAPWDARGRPAEEWPAIREAVERIRPLAGEALLSVFGQVMVDAVGRRLEESVPID